MMDIVHPMTDELLIEAGTLITRDAAQIISDAGITEVDVLTKDGQAVHVLTNGVHEQNERAWSQEKYLTPADIIAFVNYFFGLIKGVGTVDDIDHLGNRRVRTVGELLQNQFRIGLSRMERVVRERMTIQDIDTITPQALINVRPVVGAIKEFFGSSQLSQFMEQTNPLTELTATPVSYTHLGIHYRLFELFKVLFITTNPVPVKTALEMVGVPVGGFRLPLCEPSEKELNSIREVLVKMRFLAVEGE